MIPLNNVSGKINDNMPEIWDIDNLMNELCKKYPDAVEPVSFEDGFEQFLLQLDKPILPKAEIYSQSVSKSEDYSSKKQEKSLEIFPKIKLWAGNIISFLKQKFNRFSNRQKAKYVSEIDSNKKNKQLIFDIIFYAVIVMVIVGAAMFSASGKSNIFGVQYYKVLTGSMQREYPKGSVVFVKSVEPTVISVGDDITFYTDPETVVTHRVVEIIPNYNDSGQLGFRTKGVENNSEDKDIVYQQNVVGKVVFCIPHAGNILSFIASYWWLLLGISILIMIFTSSLRYTFFNDNE